MRGLTHEDAMMLREWADGEEGSMKVHYPTSCGLEVEKARDMAYRIDEVVSAFRSPVGGGFIDPPAPVLDPS